MYFLTHIFLFSSLMLHNWSKDSGSLVISGWAEDWGQTCDEKLPVAIIIQSQASIQVTWSVWTNHRPEIRQETSCLLLWSQKSVLTLKKLTFLCFSVLTNENRIRAGGWTIKWPRKCHHPDHLGKLAPAAVWLQLMNWSWQINRNREQGGRWSEWRG